MATLFGSTSSTTRKGGSTLFGGSSSGNDLDRLTRSIENAELRIQDAGYDVKDSDRRNWFEKATNLPAGQNAFFDALDLLGRPGQAILNPINNALQGNLENAAQSAWRGFSGQDRVRGSDIAEELGVDNGVGKFTAGLGIEILTDPLNAVPAGKLASVAGSALKGGGNLAKRGYLAVENMAPRLEEIRTQVVQPRYERTRDALGYMFNPEYKQTETLTGGQSDALQRTFRNTENRRNFMQEEYLNNTVDLARNTGLEQGEQVGRVLEAPLRQFEDVKGYEFPDGVRRTTDKGELMTALNTNRETIRELGKNVNQVRQQYGKQVSNLKNDLEKIDRDLRRFYFREENAELRRLNGLKNKPQLEAGQTFEDIASKAAFSRVAASPAFNLLQQKRDEIAQMIQSISKESEDLRAGNIEQIKSLTGDNEALKEAMKNPVMIQQEIQRTAREMPTDPKIRQAATQLMRQNDEIRSLAESEGIPISELEGYMTHIWSKAERTNRKNQRGYLSTGGTKGNQPNKSILNQRTLTGSVEDINERVGRDFFEPNAFFASAMGQKRLIDYIHSLAFRKRVLNDPDFAMPYEEFKKLGQDLPPNAEIINTNNYKFIKESGDILEGLASKDIGGEYVVTKAAKLLLDRYQKAASDEGTRAFLKAYDTVLSGWKRAALFSIPYHIRNDVGAKFNSWVGGMPLTDIVKYTASADKDVFNAMARGQETPLYREFREQGLGASSQAAVEFARRGNEPEDAIQKVVERQSQSRGKRALEYVKPQNWFDTSQKVGQFVDQTNRFALYKWARDKGLSPEEAAKKVRQSQFDYTNTTQFERNVMVRLFPFYRWIRNNLPYQLKQFANDPRKYANLNKVRTNAQDAAGIEEEQVPDYMKEGFYVPVSENKMLGFNLPLGDLGKISDPLKMGTDALSTLIKLPLELSTNYNFFYQKPIEQFEGQEKQFTLFGQDLGGIPMKTAYAAENLTGQIGRGLSGYLQKPETEDQDTKFRMPSLGISGILKDFDVEKANTYELYDRLNKLQDYIDYIEQQTGARPRSVNEINRGTSPSASTLFGR